jgi:phenylacetate-coenzyme A ligase PaaK-like adenylate-forming protein
MKTLHRVFASVWHKAGQFLARARQGILAEIRLRQTEDSPYSIIEFYDAFKNRHRTDAEPEKHQNQDPL